MPVPARPIRRLLLAIACLLAPGCSLRLNDHVSQPEHTVSTGSGCLSQAGDVLDRFQNGSLTASENAAFFDCTHQALSTFLQFADGKRKDSFAPEELGGFLTKYFLQGKEIRPALLNEAMALKTAFVGGPADRLSRDDLRRIMDVLDHARVLTDSLRTVMPLDASKYLARGYTGAEFETAMTTFINAVGVFGDSLKDAQGAYPFERFTGLLHELRTFLYPGEVPANHWTTYMLRLAAALPPAKRILIAPPRDEIAPADWPKLYRLAPRYYASALRTQFYLSSPFNTVQAGGLRTVERLFKDFLATFDFVLDQHPGGVITSDEIDDFLVTFHDQDMLPCRPETARQFIKVLFGRLLGGDARAAQFSVTKESLSRFQENFRFLLEGAHAAEALYRAKFGDNFVSGSLSAAEIAASNEGDLLAATAQHDDLAAVAVASLKNTPQTVRTVFDAAGPIVVIPEHGASDQYSFTHMMKIHALRSLNRLLIQSYAGPDANSLTTKQIEAFVADVFPMLAELHVADESMKASVPKRLMEASLFLYSSDGDQALSMNEALEMESLLLSTVQNAPRVHRLIADACGIAKLADAHVTTSTLAIPAACYREQFMARFEKTWSYLPGLVNYVKSLTPADRLKLFDSMAKFLHQNAAEPYSIADTQSFLHFPYYVELLFSRFDTNGDGHLDNAETAAAYPVFRPFIAEKAGAKGYNSPKDHEAIFNFLLAYRVLPTDDKWDFALRRYLLGAKGFSNDRGQIVEIFEKLLSL